MRVKVTRDDLEPQEAFATVYTVTGICEETGRRVRFGGGWRAMGEFFEEIMAEGVGLAEIEDWQVMTAEDVPVCGCTGEELEKGLTCYQPDCPNRVPEYQHPEEPPDDFPGQEPAA